MKNFRLSLSNKRELFGKIERLIAENPSQQYFVNITKREKKRSKPANDVYYVWLPEIADCLGMLRMEARRYLKYTFGLNILFAGEKSKEAQALYDSLNKSGFFQWDYESQLVEMDQRNVTSIMKTSEHHEMREQIQHFFGQQGLALEYEK